MCSLLSHFAVRRAGLTLPTTPSQLNIDPVHAAYLGHFTRHREAIQCIAVEVANHAALAADKMMMPTRTCIERSSVQMMGYMQGFFHIIQIIQSAGF
jgi:hypothetical protein